nr:MAG: putative RNA polymerase [Eriocheir sinensis bunyavirus]
MMTIKLTTWVVLTVFLVISIRSSNDLEHCWGNEHISKLPPFVLSRKKMGKLRKAGVYLTKLGFEQVMLACIIRMLLIISGIETNPGPIPRELKKSIYEILKISYGESIRTSSEKVKTALLGDEFIGLKRLLIEGCGLLTAPISQQQMRMGFNPDNGQLQNLGKDVIIKIHLNLFLEKEEIFRKICGAKILSDINDLCKMSADELEVIKSRRSSGDIETKSISDVSESQNGSGSDYDWWKGTRKQAKAKSSFGDSFEKLSSYSDKRKSSPPAVVTYKKSRFSNLKSTNPPVVDTDHELNSKWKSSKYSEYDGSILGVLISMAEKGVETGPNLDQIVTGFGGSIISSTLANKMKSMSKGKKSGFIDDSGSVSDLKYIKGVNSVGSANESDLFTIPLDDYDLILIWSLSSYGGIVFPNLSEIDLLTKQQKLHYLKTVCMPSDVFMSTSDFEEMLKELGISDTLLVRIYNMIVIKVWGSLMAECLSRVTKTHIGQSKSINDELSAFHPYIMVSSFLAKYINPQTKNDFLISITCDDIHQVRGYLQKKYEDKDLGETLDSLSEILLNWESAINGDKDSYVTGIAHLKKHMSSMTPKSSGVGSVIGLSKLKQSAEEAIENLNVKRGQLVSNEVEYVKAGIGKIFNKTNVNILIQFCINNGYFVQSSLHDLLEKLDNVLVNILGSRDDHSDNVRIMIDGCRSRIKKISILLNDIEYSLDSISKEMSRIIGETSELRESVPEIENVQYISNLKKKASVFLRIKGIINEILLSSVIGFKPLLSSKSLRDILNDAKLKSSLDYVPKPVDIELNNSPDGMLYLSVSGAKRLIQYDVTSLGDGFSKSKLSDYAKEMKVTRVPHVNINLQKDWDKINILVTSKQDSLDDGVLVIFEFGHRNRNPGKKVSADVSKYVHLGLVRLHIAPIILVTIVITPEDHPKLQSMGLKQSSYVRSMKMCDSAVSLCYIDDISDDVASRSDEHISNLYSRLSIPMLSEELMRQNMEEVKYGNSEKIDNKVIPHVVQNCLIRSVKGDTQNSILISEIDSEEFMRMVVNCMNEYKVRTDLIQYMPLKNNIGAKSDDICKAFYIGMKHESSTWFDCDSDLDVLKSLYCGKDKNKAQRLKDTFSTNATLRIRDQIAEIVGTFMVKDLIETISKDENDEIDLSVLDKYMTPQDPDLREVEEAPEHIRLLKSVMWGLDLMKVNIISSEPQEVNYAQRMMRPKYQKLDEQAKKDACLYQIICSFMDSDLTYICMGKNAAIKNFNVRDPMLIKTTMKKIGFKLTPEIQKSIKDAAEKDVKSHDESEDSESLKMMYEIIHLRNHYRLRMIDMLEKSGKSLETIMSEVLNETEGDIVPVTFSEEFEVIRDNKVDTGADIKSSVSVLYLLLSMYHKKDLIKDLYEPAEVMDRLTSNKKPKDIVVDRLKSMVKRQTKFKKFVNINEFKLCHLLHIPIDLRNTAFSEIIEKFWENFTNNSGTISPTSLKSESVVLNKLIIKFCHSTAIIDDLIVSSVITSRLTRLVDFKKSSKASFHRVVLTDRIHMNVVMPKKGSTLFKIFLSVNTGTKSELSNSPINIDEAAFLPIMNAPYYYLFYFEKLVRRRFPKLISMEKIDNLITEDILEEGVIHSVVWINEIVELMGEMEKDVTSASSKLMRLITDNLLSTGTTSQLCFHAMFMKLISIPAICVNDKSHNTVTQNIRYVFMSKLSDQFSPEGLGEKMQEFSRSLECNMHIRFMQLLSCAIIQKRVKNSNTLEKKAIFSSDVFIDPVTLSKCDNEDDFISAIYNNHGYVRGIMSSQSNANVHNAFFKIPLSATDDLVESFKAAASCCVDEFSDEFIKRDDLCDNCKSNADKYCRISQIQIYGFETTNQLMSFMASSFKLALTSNIKGTFGCPYFQEVVGRIAASSYRDDDAMKCTNDLELRSIPRTDLLQSTSIVSQFNTSFNPSKAQSKVSQRIHGSLFKGLLSGQSIISDSAIDEVERMMESRGIHVRTLIDNIRSGISPHVKLNEKQDSEIDVGESNVNFTSISDVLLQDETSSSAVKLISRWIIWSIDSINDVPLSEPHRIPTKLDIISTLSSIEAKTIITGEQISAKKKQTSHDISKERVDEYEKLIKNDYGERIGLSGRSISQIKRRLNKRIAESNDKLHSISNYKSMMIAFGNFVISQLVVKNEHETDRENELTAIDQMLTEATYLGVDDVFKLHNFDTSEFKNITREKIVTGELYLPKEIGPSDDGEESLLLVTNFDSFLNEIKSSETSSFQMICDDMMVEIDSALLYEDDETHKQGLFSVSSLEREHFEEQIKFIDEQVKLIIDKYPEIILKHTIEVLRLIAQFPVSVVFPNHYMNIYDSLGYKEFCKHYLLKSVNNCHIVSCLVFCYGDGLGESIIKSKNLRVSDPEIKNIILLTTPLIDSEFLIFPVIPILDASFRLGETRLAMMRMSRNGVRTKRTSVINIKSDRVVFELSSSISSTGIPLLWDSVATHLSHDISFVQKIAAKAQFGGERDLVVQDLKTKEVMALLERVSKQYLHVSSNDILVHPNKKKDVIMKIADLLGRVLSGEDSSNLAIFSSDETKWGPTHNAMGFLNILKRLFSSNKNYYNLLVNCCILNISKKVLINPRMIESVLSYITSHNIKVGGLKNGRYGLTGPSGKEIGLKESGMLISSMADGADSILFNCILRGLTYMSSFTHMGQGIFHATSSLAADCYVRFLSSLKQFISRKQLVLIDNVISPDIEMKTLRSSDDSITIAQSRTITKKEFIQSVKNLYYMNTAVCHTMNLRKSVKHMGGLDAVIGEVYSTFTTDRTMIPSIKTLMAIITAPPSSTLLNTALMRYNLSRSCIENSAKLTDVVFSNTLAYSRDTMVHPKSSCSVRCGQSYPMCYSSRPDISMRSLFSDPFSSELDKITEQIRLVLYKFTADELAKSENSVFDVRLFADGDLEMSVLMRNMITSSEKEGVDLDIELHSALCCGLKPGEVFDMAHDIRRSVRVKESGIYSDVQSVPQSRKSVQKFNEVRAAVSNQLSQDKSVIIDLIELASTRVVPKTLDTVIIKASQSVRNQDPNTQRSLNPINAFNQSVHGVLGWYFNVPTFIDCPRAQLTSGFTLTSASKFTMWEVNQKKISTKENMLKFLSFHQYLISLRSYITPFNLRLNELETNCSMASPKLDQTSTGWRSLNKTVKSTTIVTDYNLFCSFLIDEVVITLQGHLVPHRIVMSDLSTLSVKSLNLIALPIIARVAYDASRSEEDLLSQEDVKERASTKLIALFEKYEIIVKNQLILLSVDDSSNIINYNEAKTNAELFNQVLTIIKHWSDLISSSQKQFNPLYIEVSGDKNQSTEEDLVYHNLSQTFNYSIKNVIPIKQIGGSKQLMVKQKETEILTLVSIGSISIEEEHERIIQSILRSLNEIKNIDQNEEYMSYNVKNFLQYSKPSHIGTRVLSVESYQIHGQTAFIYKSKRTTNLVMLSTSNSNDQSYLIAEDPASILEALEQIEQYIMQIKYKRTYKEIMLKLSMKSFNKGIHSKEIPLLEDKAGNFIPNLGPLVRDGVYRYALISGIYRQLEPMSQIVMTKSNRYQLSRNRLTSITELITDKLGKIVSDKVTIGSFEESSELSIAKRELFGEQSFRRADVDSIMEILGATKLRPIRESALNYFDKKLSRTNDEKGILELISSIKGSENQIQSNGSEIYVPGGSPYRKTVSSFITVIDQIYRRDNAPLNYNALGVYINLLPVDLLVLRSKMDKVFGTKQIMWSALNHLRTLCLNMVGLSDPPKSLPEGMNMMHTLVDEKEIMMVCSINEMKSVVSSYEFPVELKSDKEKYDNSIRHGDVFKQSKRVVRLLTSILMYEMRSMHVRCKVKKHNETGEFMCLMQTDKIESDLSMLFFVGFVRLIKKGTYSFFNEFLELYSFICNLSRRDVSMYPQSIVKKDSVDVIDLSNRVNINRLESIPEEDDNGDTLYSSQADDNLVFDESLDDFDYL